MDADTHRGTGDSRPSDTRTTVNVNFAWPAHNLYVLLAEPGVRTSADMHRDAAALRATGKRVLCVEPHEVELGGAALARKIAAYLADPSLEPPVAPPPDGGGTLYVAVHAPGRSRPRAELEQVVAALRQEGTPAIVVEADVLERPEILCS